jgi:hypothetical protein
LTISDGGTSGRHPIDERYRVKPTQSMSLMRAQMAQRRMLRQRSRRLGEELATFRTPAEKLELTAVLNRHRTEEVEELEALLAGPTGRPVHL